MLEKNVNIPTLYSCVLNTDSVQPLGLVAFCSEFNCGVNEPIISFAL